jgi:outer membrane immunogenic protein
MKATLLSSVSILAIAAAANAADLPTKAPPLRAPVPTFSWSGCHVGGHIGWGWQQKDFSSTTDVSGAGGGSGGAEVVGLPSRIDGDGFLGGAQAGCDYQLGFLGSYLGGWANNFVIGFEGKLSAADIDGSAQEILASPPSKGTATPGDINLKANQIASVTGRLGYALGPQALIYGRGGWAWVHDKFDFGASHCVNGNPVSCSNTTVATAGTFFEDRSGWTAGGGIELPVTFLRDWFGPNWTWFVEYNYYDFGSKNHAFAVPGGPPGPPCSPCSINVNIHERLQTLMSGLNYRFWTY